MSAPTNNYAAPIPTLLQDRANSLAQPNINPLPESKLFKEMICSLQRHVRRYRKEKPNTQPLLERVVGEMDLEVVLQWCDAAELQNAKRDAHSAPEDYELYLRDELIRKIVRQLSMPDDDFCLCAIGRHRFRSVESVPARIDWCFGSEELDCEGYDEDGYSIGGYDRNGYDLEGFNWMGIDRSGFDARGIDENGRHRDG